MNIIRIFNYGSMVNSMRPVRFRQGVVKPGRPADGRWILYGYNRRMECRQRHVRSWLSKGKHEKPIAPIVVSCLKRKGSPIPVRSLI